MSKYEDKHPYRMKFFEAAVEGIFSIAGSVLVTLLMAKLSGEKEKKEEPRYSEEQLNEAMKASMSAATVLTHKYGEGWMFDDAAQQEYLAMMTESKHSQ